jgi:hypothetical protein
MSVVFPDPEGPTKAIDSPGFTSSEIFLRVGSFANGYWKLTPLNESSEVNDSCESENLEAITPDGEITLFSSSINERVEPAIPQLLFKPTIPCWIRKTAGASLDPAAMKIESVVIAFMASVKTNCAPATKNAAIIIELSITYFPIYGINVDSAKALDISDLDDANFA